MGERLQKTSILRGQGVKGEEKREFRMHQNAAMRQSSSHGNIRSDPSVDTSCEVVSSIRLLQPSVSARWCFWLPAILVSKHIAHEAVQRQV